MAVALAVWVAVDLRQAHASLRAAERDASQAQVALLDGDMALAAERFGSAQEAFETAGDIMARPAVRLMAVLPVASQNVDVVRALSDSGALVADAGRSVSGAVDDLPGGPAALAPTGGRLPVDGLAGLAPALQHAAARIDAADARMADAPETWLVGPVAGARADFLSRLDAVVAPARAAGALADALPAFLGADEPRRYFFGAQNPAELRGTGGLIGAWTELTIREGQLEFGDFETISTLTLPGEEALTQPPPDEDYGARYTRFSAAGHGSNINMTPDFPTAAEAIANLYERQRGQPLDGVIVADPYMFEALLRVTGPVEVPEVRRVDADTVVDFVTRDQYAEFDENDPDRKPVLGEVAKAALGNLLAGGGEDPARTLRVLGQVAGAGHLLLHSQHAHEQEAFAAADVAGAFPVDHDGALLAVVTNNAGANKLDTFLEQELEYEVWLAADGSARGRAQLHFRNDAPTEGFHQTVLGPNFDGVSGPGENLLYVSTYCAPECELLDVSRDGEASTIGTERELGATVFPANVRLPSGGEADITLEWEQPDAWDGSTFSLTIPEQPLMRTPVRRVIVHPPLGRELSTDRPTSPREDGALGWESQERERIRLDFAVRESPSWWQRFTRESA
jgi:hypothetical protein